MKLPLRSVFTLSLLVLLAGCGSGRARLGADAADAPDRAAPQAATPAVQLPAPSALAALPHQATAANVLLHYGAEFDSGLPNQAVAASGLGGIFSGTSTDLSNSAYAIYTFNTQDFSGAPSFGCSWGKLPDGPTYAWIGVANFSTDRWDWYNASTGVGAHVSAISDFRSSGGESFVAIVLAAKDDAELATVQLGIAPGYDEVEDNDSPATASQTLSLDPDALFIGHVGHQPYVNGPDGDGDDWYLIDAQVGDWVTVEAYADNPDLFLGLALTTAKGELIGLPAYTGGYGYVRVGRQPVMNADDLPLRLEVSTAGSTEGTLYALRILSDPSFASNFAVLPSLKADVYSGNAPLTVNFDGSESVDGDNLSPDPIVDYMWDWNGDLIFDEDSGSDPTVSHTFTQPGIYRVFLKCTDSSGQIGITMGQNYYPRGSLTITVGDIPYDERENNDDVYNDQEYNQLPALPFSGYRGNAGPAPATLGYDGDTQDRFVFSANAGEKWTFISDFDAVPPGFDYSPALAVERLNFGNLGLHFSTTRCFVGVQFDETADYHLIFSSPVLRDYQLSAIAGLPPQAVTLSIDSSDRGAIPFNVDFSATATEGHGALTKYEWDFDGDGTWDADSGSTPSISHSYPSTGIFKPKVRVTDAGGFYGDSDGMSTVYAWPVAYDEVEDNDSTPQSLSVYPVTDFKGNVGNTGLNDGDIGDLYALTGFAAGQSVHVSAHFDGPDGLQAVCALANGNGQDVVVSPTGSADRDLRYSIKPTDTLPIRLRIVLYAEDENFDPLPLNSDYTLNIDAPNDTPVPAITAPTLTGPTPLMVDFDAAASTDGDGIAKYEFDLNNDNNWLDNGNDATLSHVYSDPGSYVVRVRVTDTLGNVSSQMAFVQVIAGSGFYDEVENDDDWMNPQPLPAFPFTDFRGSIGSGAGYASTDGDNDDFFGFSATAGQVLTVDFHCNGDYANSLLWLYNSSSGYVTSISPSKAAGATEQLQQTLEETGNYYLWVQAFVPGFGDYSFDATLE